MGRLVHTYRNVAIESMGGKTFGFSGGREDIWAPEEDIIGELSRSGWKMDDIQGIGN